MKSIIILFGILMFLAGVSLIFAPEIIFGFIENNQEKLFIYLSAIGVRLLLGIFFLKLANESKFPLIIKILGIFFIFAAIFLIIIGQEGMQNLITSFSPIFKPYTIFVGLGTMAFSSFLIYSFMDQKIKKHD